MEKTYGAVGLVQVFQAAAKTQRIKYVPAFVAERKWDVLDGRVLKSWYMAVFGGNDQDMVAFVHQKTDHVPAVDINIPAAVRHKTDPFLLLLPVVIHSKTIVAALQPYGQKYSLAAERQKQG